MKYERKKVRYAKWKVVLSIFLLISTVFALIFSDKIERYFSYKLSSNPHLTSSEDIKSGSYSVDYIDVGQGNSTFIKLPDGKNVLIDGGNTQYGETVVKYLESQSVTKIDYLIATHADSDHIGGLNFVLENFEIVNIYRPFQVSFREKTSEEILQDPDDTEKYIVYEYEDLAGIHSLLQEETNNRSKVCKIYTSVYRQFIYNIYTETYTSGEERKLSNITVFYDGLRIVGENYEIEFYAPLARAENYNISDYSERTSGFATIGYGASNTSSNDNSAIFTIECFDDKFLFVGDARFTEGSSTSRNFSEYDFIDNLTFNEKLELAEVDVLLMGHHGSKYSTSTELLDLICPRFVVISVGANNYGHPDDEALQRVSNSYGLEKDYLLRTDTFGDIVFSSVDGELMYYAEKLEIQSELEISFKLLVVIILCFILIVVWSIRVKPSKKQMPKHS